MKSEGKKTNGCHSGCLVQKCTCGAFHLRYRYAMVVLHKHTLFQIMDECYRREEQYADDKSSRSSTPMIIMLGIVSLIVPEDDFSMFSKAIHDAVSEELGLSALFDRTSLLPDAERGIGQGPV